MNFENTLLLYKIAKYYYVDHMSQQEISEKINISRPQISRLLKKALDAGIVEINVNFPTSLNRKQLVQKLEQRLSLNHLVLTPSSQDKERNDRSLYIGAAEYLKEALSDAKYIGIGWGQTLYNVSLHLSKLDDRKERTFFAVSGTSGTSNPYFQTNNIVDRFSERFHANAYYNNFPSQINPDLFTTLEAKRYHTLKSNWNHLDTVVIGLSGIAKIGELYSDEFDGIEILRQAEQTMTGDILGNFFSNDDIFKFPGTRCISSLDIAHIKKMEHVICIAHGESKVQALITAAKLGYIKTLITDDNTGRMMLEYLEQ